MGRIIILIFAAVLGILFWFVPLGGETGFQSLWNESPFIAILLSLVPAGFFTGWLITTIKKW
jgi:hypothetical protein